MNRLHKIIALAVAVFAAADAAAASTAGELAGQMAEVQALIAGAKFRPAVARLDDILRQHPGEKQALRQRGLCYMHLGQFDRAIGDLKVSIDDLGPYRERKFPGRGAYLDWKRAQEQYADANAVFAAGDYERAIGMYELALSIYGHYPQCLHNLAIAQGKKGLWKQAEDSCMQAISLRWDDWKFWKSLGYFLFKQGKLDRALLAFRKAMELAPPESDRAQLIEDAEIIKDYLSGRVK